jgi:uncharacterized damage-inducible protein DinB
VIPGSKRIESRIVPEPGCRSAEVALKLAEIAEVHGQLVGAVRALAPAQFTWQPSPGRNTVGMLVAHIAVAEVHLGQVGLRGERDGHVADVLGIGVADDGMPLAPDGLPPSALDGRTFAFYDDLLARALAHTRFACAEIEDSMLAQEIVRPPRPDGSYRVFDRRWVLHHMVEHAAQHLGQILVLKRGLPVAGA